LKFPGSTKILKKLKEHQINQSKRKNFQKKVYLVPQNCKGAKNLYGGYLTEFAGSTQNPEINIGISNQPIKTKNFPNKVCLVPQMCTGAKNSYRGYPTELAPGA
jgi:hypothetical protein